MLRVIIFGIGLVVVGLILGLNLSATPEPEFAEFQPLETQTQTVANSSSFNPERLESLEQKLAQEISARQVLSQQVERLKAQLQSLQALAHESDQLEQQASSVDVASVTPDVSSNPIFPEARSNKQILLAMGLDETVAEQLKEREESKEMDFLYLRNKATREGWFGTERYFEESQKLENASNIYRQELGDENYDRYLYESSQFNRIEVKSVLANSPAAEAGIEAGDVIFSYDNQRVFNWSELTALTATGEAGQSINIEIVREDQRLSLFLPRGPMGIRLSGKKVDPDQS